MDVLFIGQLAALALLSPYLYGAWVFMEMYVGDLEHGKLEPDNETK